LYTVAGNYNINILYEGNHIPGSPFRAAVRADLDTRAIRCYGPGLDPKGVYYMDSPTIYTYIYYIYLINRIACAIFSIDSFRLHELLLFQCFE
jgi:hypothetical protein